MSLATRLKELRLRSGKSLQEVAEKVGVSKAHIWELELGKSTNPGVELLKRLAEHFKVTVSYLVGEDEINQSPEYLQFFREFEGLNEADLNVLRNVAAHLKSKSP